MVNWGLNSGTPDSKAILLLMVSESWTSRHCSALHGPYCSQWPDVLRCDPCCFLQPHPPCPTRATLASFWSSSSPAATGSRHVPFPGCSSRLCLLSLSSRLQLSSHFCGEAFACTESGPLASHSQAPCDSSRHSPAAWNETSLGRYRLEIPSC